jgi:hypothetical protein
VIEPTKGDRERARKAVQSSLFEADQIEAVAMLLVEQRHGMFSGPMVTPTQVIETWPHNGQRWHYAWNPTAQLWIKQEI